MDNLILSKYLYTKAVSIYSVADTFSCGLSVSLLQDSAEMFIWYMAEELKVKTNNKDGLVELLKKIDSEYDRGVAYVSQIYKVNNARVNFKHHGNLPSTSDMEKFISNTYAFLRLNAKKIDIDFDNVSIADVIKDDSIKKCLKQSEKLLGEGRVEDALVSTSHAFYKIEYDAKSRITDCAFYDMERIKSMSSIWPDAKISEAEEFTDLLYGILDNLTEKIALSGLGYSVDYINSMRKLCFIVNVSYSGSITGIYKKKTKEITENNVLLLNRFILDLAIKLY